LCGGNLKRIRAFWAVRPITLQAPSSALPSLAAAAPLRPEAGRRSAGFFSPTTGTVRGA